MVPNIGVYAVCYVTHWPITLCACPAALPYRPASYYSSPAKSTFSFPDCRSVLFPHPLLADQITANRAASKHAPHHAPNLPIRPNVCWEQLVWYGSAKGRDSLTLFAHQRKWIIHEVSRALIMVEVELAQVQSGVHERHSARWRCLRDLEIRVECWIAELANVGDADHSSKSALIWYASDLNHIAAELVNIAFWVDEAKVAWKLRGVWLVREWR